jgi:hypothetical protein
MELFALMNWSASRNKPQTRFVRRGGGSMVTILTILQKISKKVSPK